MLQFHDESDAKAAVTVLDGLRFKGSQLNVGVGFCVDHYTRVIL